MEISEKQRDYLFFGEKKLSDSKEFKFMAKVDTDLNRDLVILLVTSIPWEKYRTEIEDKDVFDQIIKSIHKFAEDNENLSQFQKRIRGLGQRGATVVRQIVAMTRGTVY